MRKSAFAGCGPLACSVALLLLGPRPTPAQGADAPGSKDHPLISRYPGSVITDYKRREFDEIELPVGPAKDWDTPGKRQKLEGRVTKIFYSFPAERSTLEVSRNYQQALARGGFTIVFDCSGMAGPKGCGPVMGLYHQWFDSGSNAEDDQRTLTARLARPEGDVWASLHVCPQWAFLAVVEAKAMEGGLVKVDAEALAGDLSRTGHVAVYGIYFDTGKADVRPESEPTLAQIARLLKERAALKLYVVGHTDNVGDLALNMDLSRRRAAAVVQVLSTRHAVPPARLRADGVGPLSPVASNGTEEGRARNRRVELVEQ